MPPYFPIGSIVLAGMFIVFLGHGFLFSFPFYLERQEYEKPKEHLIVLFLTIKLIESTLKMP